MRTGKTVSTQTVKRCLARLKRRVQNGALPAWAEGERYLLAVSTQSVLDALAGIRRLDADASGQPLAFSVSGQIPADADEGMFIRALSHGDSSCRYGEPFLRVFPAMRAAYGLCRIAALLTDTDKPCPGEYDGLVRLLYRAKDIDWERVHTAVSRVEKALCGDPSGVYPRCDRESRQWYRDELQRYAKKHGITEEDAAERLLTAACGAVTEEGRSLSAVLFPPAESHGTAFHILLFLGAFCLSCVSAYLLLPYGIWRALLGGWFLFLPYYALLREVGNILAGKYGRRAPILRLSMRELTEDGRTLVVITTLLSGTKGDDTLFRNLERFYLRNRDKNLRIGILGDLREADSAEKAGDDAVIRAASDRIDALNGKYGKDGEPFYLFVRPRSRGIGEKRYFGWERKRGAVLSLVRYLRGEEGGFSLVRGNTERLCGIRYLCTLDSDTELPSGAVLAMVSAMLHPQNRPVIRNGRVIRGIGILQPAMAVSLEGAAASRFTLLCTGKGGADPYTRYMTDGEWNLYGEGSFCGKGLFSVDAFYSVLDGAFPEEYVLSHDFLEGQRLGCMNFPGVTCTDRIPSGVVSYFERQSRWVRGDIQALRFAFRRVPRADGKITVNPVPLSGRIRVLDHALLALVPAAILRCVLFGALFGFSAGTAALLWLAAFSSGLLRPLLLLGNAGAWRAAFRRFHGLVLTDFRQAWGFFCFRLIFASYEGAVNLEAAAAALWRMLVSHKNMLAWVTAGEAEKRADEKNLWGLFCRFRRSVLPGLLLLLFSRDPVSLTVGVLWITAPFTARYLSHTPRRAFSENARPENIEDTEKSGHGTAGTSRGIPTPIQVRCREEAAEIWRFFAENVNAETSYLPPDNVQWFPFAAPRRAERTSPTNIGLYLVSCVAACDFGLITPAEMTERLSDTLGTLSRMETYRGHYYNWYDTAAAVRIGAPYLSTVDSGNLVCAALSAAGGARDYMAEDIRLAGVCSRLEALAFGTDFSFLYDERRGLLHLGWDTEKERAGEGYYDLFCSEARSAVYFGIAAGQLPADAWEKLGRPTAVFRRRLGVCSWSGSAFEYFMPALWLPTPENSFSAEILHTALEEQCRAAETVEADGKHVAVFGKSEGAYFALDGEKNYRYQPCGVSSLGLAPGLDKERLCMPYASFLMLPTADSAERMRLFENLDALRTLGMYGPDGYYEALDMTPARLGGGRAVVRSVMAHHLGMSMAALADTAFDFCFVRRFLQDPAMEAGEALLRERIPADADCSVRPTVFRPAVPDSRRTAAVSETALPVLAGLPPRYAVLSNTQTCAVVSSFGTIVLSDGGLLLVRDGVMPDEVPMALFFLYDGRVYTAWNGGRAPEGSQDLPGGDSGKPTFTFQCDDRGAVWRAVYSDGVTAEAAVYTAAETRTFSVRASLSENGKALPFVLTFCFRPILAREKSYRVHKSFSDLFLQFFPDEAHGAVRVRRRVCSSDERAPHLTVSSEMLSDTVVCTDAADLFWENADGGALVRLAALPVNVSPSILKNGPAGENSVCPEKDSALSPLLLLRGSCQGECTVSLHLTYDGFPSERDLGDIPSLPSSDGLSGTLHADMRLLCGGLGAMDETVSSYLHAVITNSRTHIYREEMLPPWALPRERLWKHGISGDLPILYLTVGRETAAARIEKHLNGWKYLLLCGVSCDLVLGIQEEDAYQNPVFKRCSAAAEACGLSFFLSGGGGGRLFLLSEGEALRDGIPFCAVWRDGEAAGAAERTADAVSAPGGAQTLLLPENAEMPSRVRAESDGGKSDSPVSCTITEERIQIRHGRKTVPWSYILSNGVFGTLLCDSSLGFTFFSDSRECRVTPWYGDAQHPGNPEQLLMTVTRDSLNSGTAELCRCASETDWYPDRAEYRGTVSDLSYTLCVRIPDRRRRKDMTVTVRNCGTASAFVSLRYRLEPLLGVQPEDGGIVSCYTGEGGTLSFSSRSSEACSPYRAVVTLSGSADDVRAGRDSRKTLFCEGGCMLSPGDEQTFVFTLSVFRNGERAMPDTVFPPIKTPLLPQDRRIRSGDRALDALASVWLPVQTMHSRLWARCGYWQPGGAYGFRDQLQDAVNMLELDPAICRQQLLRCAAHQYTEGDVQHWWHPLPTSDRAKFHKGIRTRYSDDLLWLPFALTEYLKKTGDDSVCGCMVRYLESPVLAPGERERYEEPLRSGLKESMYMHGVRAIECVLARGYGLHGLPLFGGGDWNDGMNSVGAEGRGESVWLGQFLLLVLGEWLPLARAQGDDFGAEKYGEEMKRLAAAVEEEAWNGAWYRRAWYDDGTPMGEKGGSTAEIDLLPQAFSAIVNDRVRLPGGKRPFDETRVHTAMLSAYERLFDGETGLFRLLSPPFDRAGKICAAGSPDPGYIAAYPPGIRENGGQYTHAAIWGAMGLYAVGEKEKGDTVLYALDPEKRFSADPERWKKEPYALCGDVLTAKGRCGEGGWSQYTGAAGWYFRLLCERFGEKTPEDRTV